MSAVATDQSTTLHGVYLDVLGIGILLTGKSGIGKSELALGLIDRGHLLIADDSVQFHVRDQQLIGECPSVLQDFLEVRGLGILNIRTLFGDRAICMRKVLGLIIKLATLDDRSLQELDRLHGVFQQHQILGMTIPEVTIPVSSGRNLAILVESAVRNQLLKLAGYDASKEFIQRHERLLADNERSDIP